MGGLSYLDQGDTEFAADQEIAEYAGGSLDRRYVRLPGSVDKAFLMVDYTSGSVPSVATTDAVGMVFEQYCYSPYGESGAESGGGFLFRFTGQKLDPETCRFLQADRLGAGISRIYGAVRK